MLSIVRTSRNRSRISPAVCGTPLSVTCVGRSCLFESNSRSKNLSSVQNGFPSVTFSTSIKESWKETSKFKNKTREDLIDHTADVVEEEQFTKEKWKKYKRQHFGDSVKSEHEVLSSKMEDSSTIMKETPHGMMDISPPHVFFQNQMRLQRLVELQNGNEIEFSKDAEKEEKHLQWKEMEEKRWNDTQDASTIPKECDQIMDRREVVELLLRLKKSKGITFADIAKKIRRNEVFTTAAILGELRLNRDDANAICEILDVDKRYKTNVMNSLMEPPMKGIQWELNNCGIPSDPTIYRWFEIMQIYGEALKRLMNETFNSDGTINPVETKLNIDKISNNRVKITLIAPFNSFPTS